MNSDNGNTFLTQPAGHENQFTGFHDRLGPGVELDSGMRLFIAIGRTPSGKLPPDAVRKQVALKGEPGTAYCQSEGMPANVCQ